MKTEDIINALAKPLGAAALNQRGYPADIETVIDKAVSAIDRLNEHSFAMNWSLFELRDLFGEYGAPACESGAVYPAQFAAWLVGLVRELHNRTFSQHERIVDDKEVADSMRRRLEEAETENRKLSDQITTLQAMLKNVEGQRDATEPENLLLREEVVFRDTIIDAIKEELEQQAQPADRPLPPLKNA